MALTDPPLCERCSGATSFVGRISLPPQMIYRCEACGHAMWLTNGPTPYQQPSVHQPEAQQPPQQQQQEQPQPHQKKEYDGSGP
jgi:hypothetical protein